jgi:hypothetical protein
MRNLSNTGRFVPEEPRGRIPKLIRCYNVFLIISLAAMPAAGAQFEFSTLIRWGGNGAPSTNWELGVGDTPGTLTNTANATPAFSTTANRMFEVDYARATNTATLRLYAGTTASGGSDAVTFNPAGGGTLATTVEWRLPAASFFVQATPVVGTLSQIQVSNLTLVTGTILAPFQFQASPMSVSQITGTGGGQINHSGDVVFVGDAGGNWRVRGLVNMAAFGPIGVNGLSFGLTASASVPEPMSSVLIGLGLAVVAICRRRGRLGSGF